MRRLEGWRGEVYGHDWVDQGCDPCDRAGRAEVRAGPGADRKAQGYGWDRARPCEGGPR